MTKRLILAAAIAACGGGESEPIPSCQQAIGHYYGAGCVWTDLQSGQPIPEGEMTARCLDLAGSIPSERCETAFENYLLCNAGVPSPASTNTDCDCSQEVMALVQCQ